MGWLPRLARGLVVAALLAGTLLLLAGRADLPFVDACAAVIALFAVVGSLVLDPVLVRERLRGGQRGADPGRLLAIRLLVAVTIVIALVDVGRLGLSPPAPPAVQALALLVMAAAFAWTLWAMRANPFFVPVIRVQPERGHHVVSAGPYALVRHPGYAGMMVLLPAFALAIGSWWALLGAIPAAILFVGRAAHEDRFLRERLAGYEDYTHAVRHRLLPAVWVLVLACALGARQAAAHPGHDGPAGPYNLIHPVPPENKRPLSTDRPDRTESPYTVDAGYLQVELDAFAWTRDRVGDEQTRELSIAATNIKLGLLDWLDAQVVIEPLVRRDLGDSILIGPAARSGFGDVVTRLKVNLFGNDRGRAALAVMPFAAFPAGKEGFGRDVEETGVIVPLSVEAPGGWGVGAMAEVDARRGWKDEDFTWIASMTASHDIEGDLAGYVELYGAWPGEAKPEHTLDAGLTYALGRDVQVDAGVNLGITANAEDVTVFMGVAVRR